MDYNIKLSSTQLSVIILILGFHANNDKKNQDKIREIANYLIDQLSVKDTLVLMHHIGINR